MIIGVLFVALVGGCLIYRRQNTRSNFMLIKFCLLLVSRHSLLVKLNKPNSISRRLSIGSSSSSSWAAARLVRGWIGGGELLLQRGDTDKDRAREKLINRETEKERQQDRE